MRDHPDAIVVGAGVQGMCVALHLLAAGLTDVRILERDEAFQGTSSAAAGFLGLWAMQAEQGPEELAVERYGLSFYEDLQHSGYDIDFLRNGLLIITDDAEVWPEVMRWERFGRDVGNRVVDSDDVFELTSGLVVAAAGVRGVLHPPGAQLFAAKLGPALTARVREAGGVIEERTPVTEVLARGGRVAGVRTPRGIVESRTVVLATGAWTNRVLSDLDVYLPMLPRITSRVMSEPLDVPRTMPALFVWGVAHERYGDLLWARWQGDALVWGGPYRVHPADMLIGGPVPGRFDDVPLDGVLHMRRLAAEATRLMPVFGQYKSMTVKHGAPCFTPDDRALIGRIPSIEGLYVMTGDCEAGVTRGPGFGKVLADEIVHGTSDLAESRPWRVDRFGPVYSNDAEVALGLARLREQRIAAA